MMPPPAAATVCIAGGGPAGLMLGYLLARFGIEVTVLEKHADFLRDFRGDTIHPSTLDLMHELGLLEEFLSLPHSRVESVGGRFGDTPFAADFAHLPTRCKFIAFMPQWDFLDFLADRAAAFPNFRLLRRHKAVGLLRRGERIAGVKVKTPQGRIEIAAGLVVAADGRHSELRAAAGLVPVDLGAGIDVLWFRLPRAGGDPHQVLGRFDAGKGIVLLDRGDYWQCGLIIEKDGLEALQRRGIDALKADIAFLTGIPIARMAGLNDWEALKLLSVKVDRLDTWHRPGFLCIGDAAHAMSPIGGVGINLAIQDAVAAANLLAPALKAGTPPDLAAVGRRRLFPARMMQAIQVAMQNYLARKVLGKPGPTRAPLPLRLFGRFAFARRLAARVVGMGFRPEHIRLF